ncbi:MAG: winged helix-turn-helix transcriptional regulator [Planctomycetes bacterium]|nr:winged helix-turn-helix transcriptional regulator [Planctomycetota bacterium]
MSAERVHELLERLGNLLRSEQRRLGATLGLQPVQFQALVYLAQCNRYSDSPRAVAEYLGLTKGTVSQTLAVLQERGLVLAADDADDGRRVHLRLSAKGRRAAAQMPPAVLARALATLGDADALAARLERLLVDLQRDRDGRTFGVCRTCRHFRGPVAAARCGLTGEPLPVEQTTKLCREHAPPVAADD